MNKRSEAVAQQITQIKNNTKAAIAALVGKYDLLHRVNNLLIKNKFHIYFEKLKCREM